MLCTSWHTFAEASESCPQLDTCSQRHPNVLYHLVHLRRDLKKLCTTRHTFAEASKSYAPLGTYLLGSPNLLGETCETFTTDGTAYERLLCTG